MFSNGVNMLGGMEEQYRISNHLILNSLKFNASVCGSVYIQKKLKSCNELDNKGKSNINHTVCMANRLK